MLDVFLVIATIILLISVFAGFSAAPWVPIKKRDEKALLGDCNLKRGELFVELGCGDGRLIAQASRLGARAIGYEINPLLWLLAYARNIRYRNRTSIRLGNLWKADISKADVVMVFLMPRVMARMEEKAKREMKSGSRLACYIFGLPSKKPYLKHKSWTIYKY